MDNQKSLTEWEALQRIKRSHKPKSEPDTDDFAKRLEQFEAETRCRRTYSKIGLLAICSGLPFTAMLLIVFVSNFPLAIAMLTLCASLAGGAALLVLCFRAATGAPSDETLRFVAQRNPQAIGSLLMRLSIFPYHKEVELIEQAIIDNLNHISPDEANSLPRDVRERLNRRLINATQVGGCTVADAEFCLAWMRVLAEIGGERDLRGIRFLTETPAHSPLHAAMRKAAFDCLPHIMARIAAQEPGKTLLRASDSPPTAPETLLRPAAKSNPTAPNELLRPAEAEEDAGGSDSR